MLQSASTRLLARSNDIMELWEKRAQSEVLSALKIESLALHDTLPELLTLIAHVLSTTTKRTEVREKWEKAEGIRVGEKHGEERANCQVYTMGQMIFEYHILRQVICDVLEEEQPLQHAEREIILCALEQAVNDAASQFSMTFKRAQEQLAAALTHDLRGPLTVASLATQRILRRPQDADHCHRAAVRIASGLDRLELMIQNLLDVSRIKSGKKMQLHIEPFDISQLAHQLAEDFNILYADRLTVTSQVTGMVHWDKAEITRLIENLTSNAAKYGEPTTPITVVLQESNHTITLKIHNEGAAIPLEEQEKLFNQFQRGNSRQKHKGWGIGLTVVKGIVQSHQGSVHIESTHATGTTFVVRMPKDARSSETLSG
jgi:signal transduction histidine kinase